MGYCDEQCDIEITRFRQRLRAAAAAATTVEILAAVDSLED